MDRYFKSYEELDVHRLMLNDTRRTVAYKNAIFNSVDKFRGKVVMDVGAGTGILSIFCAQAGARLVYAIEASELATLAEEVSIENNVQHVIKVIHKKVEDLDPNEIEKVDVIVSEWMGFYLVHEGMLRSVLHARNEFLKEEGTLFPSVAKLYAAPCELPSMFEFWKDVHGVDMKCVGNRYRQAKSMKPEIMSIGKGDLLTDAKLLSWLDLSCIALEETDLLAGEDYVCVSTKDANYQGICIWFSVEFPDGSELSTGPMDELTHWKQTIIVLPVDVKVEKDEPLAFKLALRKDETNSRKYDIEVTLLDAVEVEHDVPCFCYMTKCIVTRTYMEQREMDSLHD